MASPVSLSQASSLAVPRRRLWAGLRDTDRMNRAIGLPPVLFRPAVESFKARHFLAQATLLGLTLSYEELPFEWVEGVYYRVSRRFHSGPLVEYTGGIRLADKEGGTELLSFADIVPRNLLGTLVARTLGQAIVTKRIPGFAAGFAGAPGGAAAPPGSRALLLHRRLRHVAATGGRILAFEELKRHLLCSSETEAACLRPFELAERWGLERDDVLWALLSAARARVLELRWILLCPACRAAQAESPELRHLARHAMCRTCGTSVLRDPSATIETRFTLAAELRPELRETYCLGGPGNTPHRIAQLRLAPGERRLESLELPAGRVRLFCYQAGEPIELEASSGAPDAGLCLSIGKFGLTVRGGSLRAGACTLEAENALAREVLLVIDDDSWRRNLATATDVLESKAYHCVYQ